MLKIENTEVLGWEHAIRGMRNPMNSWEKSDSGYRHYSNLTHTDMGLVNYQQSIDDEFELGPNDLDLMKRLRNAGTDHRKFMRMIVVYLDITAPLYWWKEFKTYRNGKRYGDEEPDILPIPDDYLEYDIEMNSCSTMHKIAAKRFERDDFSHEHLIDGGNYILNATIDMLNKYRGQYLDSKDKTYWWQMIQLLPSSYNQRRTVMLNYEVLANIYKSRCNHKLDEWHTFCDWIEGLPYSELITGMEPISHEVVSDSTSLFLKKSMTIPEEWPSTPEKTEKAFKDRNEVIEKMRNEGNKSLDDLKKELGVVSPSKVSDKSDDGILVGALDIYTIDLNDEDLKKISAGEEIELNMDVEGEDKILRSISICIKKEPVKEG